jgi:hypothetical protein
LIGKGHHCVTGVLNLESKAIVFAGRGKIGGGADVFLDRLCGRAEARRLESADGNGSSSPGKAIARDC